MANPLFDFTLFHPAVAAWLQCAFGAPTPAQADAWPLLAESRDVLIAAPTGSGKTLAAFMAAIDTLVRQSQQGPLPDKTFVVYISPLKALSNDIHRNLELPLAGISEELHKLGLDDHGIRTFVRTGDTPQTSRQVMRKQPPHIVITTPESFYVLLGSESGRDMLQHVRTVIVDEIHALVGNKRGAHLALSLERLQALVNRNVDSQQNLLTKNLQRIGLSATQNPIEDVAHFLVGSKEPLISFTSEERALDKRRERRQSAGGRSAGSGAYTPVCEAHPLKTKGEHRPPAECRAQQLIQGPHCTIVDSGHMRQRDLQIITPPTPLQAVMSHETWDQVYDQLTALILEHHTTLIFVNTRRYAERVARHLSERIGEEFVTAHHGSLSKERRFDAEQRLKEGKLKALVATASLELGIDIGDVNLVCQIGSCRSIATFLQRAGRAGHFLGGIPKARLFPLARDELVEAIALLDAVDRGELDRLIMPAKPLDVLAQQIVAEVAAEEWNEDALFDCLRMAYPYRDLQKTEYDDVLTMLSEGYGTRRGQVRQYIHRDAVHKQLRGRRGARLTALTSGGTIPDNADFNVVLEPESIIVGTVNEDFAVESLGGDIFQLGNHAYKILRVEAGTVRVEDAHGQPPSIPFWLGEAPGRSNELSFAISRLHKTIEAHDDPDISLRWLRDDLHIDNSAAAQLVDYLWAAKQTLTVLPNNNRVIFERFFDETGGMQLVIHAPFGSRINRAWGLALRKRFCRKFDFELQAAATEDAIILSLSTSHSFPLEEVAQYLHANTVCDILVQAVLAAPMFNARWRWAANIALALPRFRGGKKIPPQLQRMYAEDLVADLFPDQIACAENLAGDREIPAHPLVKQAIDDCLHEAMDIDGLENVLRRIDSGEIEIVARDVTEPSPLALQILAARPYAFLDDAPLEERRTQAVMARRWLDPKDASDLSRLDPQAIHRVRGEAFPDAQNPDELHDALMWCGFLDGEEIATQPRWPLWLHELAEAGRVTRLFFATNEIWVAAERLPRFLTLFPDNNPEPSIVAPEPYVSEPQTRESAILEILRGRLQILGPVTAQQFADSIPIVLSDVAIALIALEQEGFVLRGKFTEAAYAAALDTNSSAVEEWCERGLLARIHRYTLNRLRAEIEPVSTRDFMRFLFNWQQVIPGERKEGSDALAVVLGNLEGFEAPASAWETEILPARMRNYQYNWLDDLCLAGRAGWARLARPKNTENKTRRAGPVRSTPIALIARRHRGIWQSAANGDTELPAMSSRAQRVYEMLQQSGASFFDEIVDEEGLLPTEVEEALAELAAIGVVTSDSFAGIRALLVPLDKRKSLTGGKRRHRSVAFGIQDAGRWSVVRQQHVDSDEMIEYVTRALLKRYGVIFWRLLTREADWLPPWRDMLRVLRRLEARGEIRGGRFVAGITGEQYALPEALAALRAARKQTEQGALICVSAADPLNLVGVILPGNKIPALTGNRILYRDGVPVAALTGDEVNYLGSFSAAEQNEFKSTLVRRTVTSPQLNYLR